jgi:ATP-binding cassette subfamily B protein
MNKNIIKELINMTSGYNANFAKEDFVASVYVYVLMICGLLALKSLSTYIMHYARVVSLYKKQKEHVVKNIFMHLTKMDYDFFLNNHSGKISASVNQIDQGISSLNDSLAKSFINHILGIITINAFLYTINVNVFLITLMASLTLITIRVWYFKKYWMIHDIRAQQHDRDYRGILNDIITNMISVKVNNSNNDYMNLVIDAKNKNLKEVTKEYKTEIGYGFYFESMLNILFIALTSWYSLELFSKNIISVGDLILIITTIVELKYSIIYLAFGYLDITRNIVRLEDAYKLLYNDKVQVDKGIKEKLEIKNNSLEFRDVDFAYDNNKVFKKFNLRIGSGENLGIIGKSGSGKTTINNLIFRFYEPSKGEILIDNKNIAEYSRDSLYENITYVPQETILLHTSIIENIRIAKRTATDEEVFEAAKKASIHDFILTLPEDYNTYVGERGIKLSGGQRQRIVLARIFLRETKIIVFDEATSALDNNTEFIIQENIHKYFKDKTVICIAHRLSTLVDMDRIIVLDNGQIIDEGKPKDIIAKYDKTTRSELSILA